MVNQRSTIIIFLLLLHDCHYILIINYNADAELLYMYTYFCSEAYVFVIYFYFLVSAELVVVLIGYTRRPHSCTHAPLYRIMYGDPPDRF